MTVTRNLKDIIEFEELKKDIAVTRSVLLSVEMVVAPDEGLEENVHVAQLVTTVSAYSFMLQLVQHYHILATRREKLWVMFYGFTTKEGRHFMTPVTKLWACQC